MGEHGIGKCNSNGELLLSLCSEFELIVTTTMFKQKDERKTTWIHPRSRHWHMIDFIITRCRDKKDIHSTRVMRGANCWTDHHMLRSKVTFIIRQKHNRQGKGKPTKLNTATAIGIVLSTIWTVLLSKGKIMKPQHQTRNGQLCSRSCTTQPRHILASQPENTRTGSTSTTRSSMSSRDKPHQQVLQTSSTISTTAAYKDACRLL